MDKDHKPKIEIRDSILLPCHHLIDKPTQVKSIVTCHICDSVWNVQYKKGTWNYQEVSGAENE